MVRCYLNLICFFALAFTVVAASVDNKNISTKSSLDSTTNSSSVEELRPSKVTPRHYAMPEFQENARQGQCHRRVSDSKVVCTPDFFFIGSSKCGTSSLAFYLQTHPMIMNVNQYAETKENHRFDPSELDSKKTLKKTADYVQKFDAESAVKEIFHDQPGFVKKSVDNRAQADAHYKSSNGMKSSHTSKTRPDLVYMPDRPLVMEYTPNYLVHDETPLLIHKAFRHTASHLKFILIVRDPVKRMISSWRFKMEKTPGGISTFKEAVKSGLAQAKCIEDCFDKYFQKGANWTTLKPEVLLHNFTDNDVNRDYMHQHCSMKLCRVQNDPSKHGFNGGNSVMAHVVKGQYMYQLMSWLRVFDLHQFLIISLEEYMETPLGTMEKIIEFLGLQMYHNNDPKGPKRNDGMNMSYYAAAHKMKMKDDPVHEKLKNAQLRMKRTGWDNQEEVLEVMKIILNQRPLDHSLDKQITETLTAQLKDIYKGSNQRLFKLLGWPDNYY